MIKKKKRKIKVPAAAFGIGGGANFNQYMQGMQLQGIQAQNLQYGQSLLNNTYQNPTQQYIQQYGPASDAINQMAKDSYYNNASNQFKLDMASKNPAGAIKYSNAIQNGPDKLTEAQQYSQYSEKSGGAGGAGSALNVGDLASVTTAGIASIAGYGPKSEATNRDEVVTQSLADVSKGVMSGAAIGSVAGPMGAAIGAGVGAIIGSIGRKGREAEMTSFTDYDEGTLGTGLIGAFSNKKLRRKREAIKQNAWKNKAAVQGTGQLQAEYNLEHGTLDANTFAYGGSTDSLAYVDDGELISTPDGAISKVPEQGKPTDSNLISLPEGSKILSDKLKVPGTKKTFAQLGEEMMATKKSKFNDIYAQNAAKLNEMNNKSIHDQLFEMQEAVKAKKGIKRKYKNAVIAAEEGTVIPYTEQPRYSKRYQLRQDGTLNFLPNYNEKVSIGDTIMYKGTPYKITSRYTTNKGQWLATPINTKPNIYEGGVLPEVTVTASTNDYGLDQYLPEVVVTAPKRRKSSGKRVTTSPITPAAKDMPPLTMAGLNIPQSSLQSSIDNGTAPTPDVRQPIPRRIPTTDTPEDNNNYVDWGDIASSIGSLAPIISNLYTRPEYQDANYNPYASAIMKTMRNRRYDISPVIRDIENNRATSNYNADQMNTNTGANLAFRLQNASNTARAIADIRAQESNINNDYLADYANVLNDLGRQWANESNRVQEANIANRAQARNIRRAGLSGLSQWFQNRELMRNQRERDNAMLELYRDFLNQGFQSNTISNWDRYIRRGGNR